MDNSYLCLDYPLSILKNQALATDEELLTRAQAGETSAFDTLYDRYYPILFVHAMKKLANEQDAKDLVQDLFLSFYSSLPQLGSIHNVGGYLYTLLKNRILNFLEKNLVRYKYLEQYQFQEAYKPVENYIFEKELQAQIEAGIQALPEKMRLVFEMSRIQMLNHKEIGDQLQISDKTVKKQIVNALKIIRSKIHFFFF